MSEVRNLVLAVVASVVIVLGWRFVQEKFFFHPEEIVDEEEVNSLIPDVIDTVEYESRDDALLKVPRVVLQNSSIKASVAKVGGLIDDVSLLKYKVSVGKDSSNVLLMSPENTIDDSMVEFGWIDQKHEIKVPSRDTLWTLEGEESYLEGRNFSMYWDNGEGFIFRLKFSLDESYMFTVTQEVENNTENDAHLALYGRINRVHNSANKSHWISHEGVVANFGEGLREWKYKDLASARSMRANGVVHSNGNHNWIGFADKYWFSALIPDSKGEKVAFRAQHIYKGAEEGRFQIDFSKSYGVVSPHSMASVTTYLFIGAKELGLLDIYKTKNKVPLFDKAVDFGMLYFITKPVFLLLQYFNRILGNFGLAIIMLTISIKLLVLPISIKSCTSVFVLRKLQPEIARIKELYKTDNLRVSKEVSALFKKHKVSPLSGFLPVLAQIPVFFALYKVLFVTIEMRHAPLFAWIQDLSSYDTANLINLFGALPFNPPICIGIMPVLLCITMVLQQKILQRDQDSQDPYAVMKFLPYVLLFVFASFPSGLVLYWICSNIITMLQQLLIRRFVYSKSDIV